MPVAQASLASISALATADEPPPHQPYLLPGSVTSAYSTAAHAASAAHVAELRARVEAAAAQHMALPQAGGGAAVLGGAGSAFAPGALVPTSGALVSGAEGHMWECGGVAASDGSKKPVYLKRAWTPDEDELLRIAVERHGAQQWSTIAQQMVARCGKQCRERWFNHLCPTVNKGEWTEEEDRLIAEGVLKFGNRWCEIVKLLPTHRSDNAVKNRYNSNERKRARAEQRALKAAEHEKAAAASSLLSSSMMYVGAPYAVGSEVAGADAGAVVGGEVAAVQLPAGVQPAGGRGGKSGGRGRGKAAAAASAATATAAAAAVAAAAAAATAAATAAAAVVDGDPNADGVGASGGGVGVSRKRHILDAVQLEASSVSSVGQMLDSVQQEAAAGAAPGAKKAKAGGKKKKGADGVPAAVGAVGVAAATAAAEIGGGGFAIGEDSEARFLQVPPVEAEGRELNGSLMQMVGTELDLALWDGAAESGWKVVERTPGSWHAGLWDVTSPTGEQFQSLEAAIRAWGGGLAAPVNKSGKGGKAAAATDEEDDEEDDGGVMVLDAIMVAGPE